MKKLFKALLLVVGLVLLLVIGFIAYLSITEFRPGEVETVELSGKSDSTVKAGSTITLITFNTGYASLGKESDFFMDGGKQVRQSQELVDKNLAGIQDFLTAQNVDFCLLQEVDTDSTRTYHTDEAAAYAQATGMTWSYALNYRCKYVPYPLPPIGKVTSGLQTLSGYSVESAERLSLPCPFSWPVSTANLKRCLMVSYLPIEGSDQKLVIVNLHLEAYDSGEGKLAQTRELWQVLTEEYDKGNYVIAGGDFNQAFPGAKETYPIKDSALWTPGELLKSDLPEDWYYAYDSTVPTCRLLNQPYDPGSDATQYYVIDGFICSPNVKLVDVATLDQAFAYSDHNPVQLTVSLS